MESSPARRESFDIAGGRISVVVAGNRSNPALLLVHGFPSSSRSFRHIIPRLSQSCFVIAPDLPGFGESALIPDPTFARFADLIDGLLEKLGVVSACLYVHDSLGIVSNHRRLSALVELDQFVLAFIVGG